MNDASQSPLPVVDPQAGGQPTAAGQPGGMPQKSPLEILEEILGDAKNKAGAGAPAAESAQSAGAVAADPAATSADEAAKLAEIQARIEQQKIVDQQLLTQQLADLKQIEQTPEYQAKVSQEHAKEEADAAKVAATDGFEIVQLGHKKV
ncbi:MAG TPA: hypothetical protein VD999_01190 [Vitreimonas sp.]|nr:hypothetical protein [Vitreimonas sp.]